MDNIIEVQFNEMLQRTRSIWQYDYGQVLKILSGGVVLPNFLEVHFSLSRKNEKCITRIGTTVNGVTEVQIPNELLNTENKTHDYFIYAFIYVSTEKYGNTKCEIIIPVKSRIKPENPSEEPLPEPNIFHETVEAVNAAADRAKMAEQNAKESATEAGKYAASASESAVTAEKTKEDALRKVGEKKREAIEAIQNQEETSVGKITTHTDDEIQRIQNQTADSKAGLEQTITNADASKKELEHSIETAGTSKTALDKSVELAGTAKTELDTSIREAGTAKTALDESTETAGTVQETLSATVNQAGALDTSLGEKIETGTQLKTDLTASGEKAVQDIQTAGSEQLGKMQAVAEAFTADQEQIAANKKDIGSLKEDLADLQDKKITKFYASNQGNTHLPDSDKGKIQDMFLYGKSEQVYYKGKNLLDLRNGKSGTGQGVSYTRNDDGSYSRTGKATDTVGNVWFAGGYGITTELFTLKPGTYKVEDCVIFSGRTSYIGEFSFETDTPITGVRNPTQARGKTYNDTIYPILTSDTDVSWEPYTGGIPSPNPDYPQEIKSVVKPVVKVCGKNLLQPNLRYNDRAKINIKKGTKLTLICKNGVVSKGGNLKFETANGGIAWFGFDKGNVKQQVTLYDDVVAFYYLFNSEPSESYALYIGDENTYEPYKEQSVQLPYTLNAIPVASGGNVTIGGQQYIADRVVEKDGVFGIERNIREIHTNTKTMNNSEEYPGWSKVKGISDVTYYSDKQAADSRKLTFISNFTQTIFLQNNKGTNNILYYVKHIIGYSQSELIAKAIDVDMYIRLQDAIFEPLPGDIQAKLRTLVTNYPVTNISVTSDQLDGYAVFNYPISMANGWNYVKQQLGDTRDYIYDMDAKAQDIDIQSAEAYVNSEYAVALAELEV